MSFLGLYRDPTIAEVTSRCDWRIADLVDAEEPCSLYLVISPSDISRTKPLVRLVLNQIGRRLTEQLDGLCGAGRRHQLLMMLDEFPALGRLDFFETSLAFMAGYGIRAFLIAQSLNQIEKAYGENNSILDNCHVRVAFAANDERTAKRISDALGTATEQRAMRNYAGHRLAPWLAHIMVSRRETARQLLTPGEVMQLCPDEELVLLSGMAPVRAEKLRYFRDRNFAERRLPAPTVASGPYADRPAPRSDDWRGITQPQDARLAALAAQAEADDDRKPQQRPPGKGGGSPIARDEPDVTEPQLANDDDSNLVTDKRAMEQAQSLTPVASGFAFDESQHTRDLGL